MISTDHWGFFGFTFCTKTVVHCFIKSVFPAVSKKCLIFRDVLVSLGILPVVWESKVNFFISKDAILWSHREVETLSCNKNYHKRRGKCSTVDLYLPCLSSVLLCPLGSSGMRAVETEVCEAPTLLTWTLHLLQPFLLSPRSLCSITLFSLLKAAAFPHSLTHSLVFAVEPIALSSLHLTLKHKITLAHITSPFLLPAFLSSCSRVCFSPHISSPFW